MRPPFPLTPATPAVAVPVAGGDGQDLLERTAAAVAGGADLVEWRLDAWGGGAAHTMAPSAVAELVAALRAELGGVPVLATYRSRLEGGPGEADDGEYTDLLLALVAAGVDAVDVELTRPEEDAAVVVAAARAVGVVVVGSSHDFSGTPDDLPSRFRELARRGADVLKVAVTPESAYDVVRLLDAAVSAHEATGRPVVPVAMGALGVLTRVAGGLWGAPFTFAMVGEASAPGQLAVADVRAVQDVLARAGAQPGERA